MRNQTCLCFVGHLTGALSRTAGSSWVDSISDQLYWGEFRARVIIDKARVAIRACAYAQTRLIPRPRGSCLRTSLFLVSTVSPEYVQTWRTSSSGLRLVKGDLRQVWIWINVVLSSRPHCFVFRSLWDCLQFCLMDFWPTGKVSNWELEGMGAE